MAISHVKSSPVVDFTGTVTGLNSAGATVTLAATDLVRPVDWNSNHNQTYFLAGAQTAGVSSASGSDVHFSGMGAVTLSGNGSTLGISVEKQITQSSWALGWSAAHSSGFVTVAPNANTSGPMSIWPIWIPYWLSAGFLEIIASVGFTSNTTNDSGKNTGGMSLVLYSRPTNSDSSRLTSVTGTNYTWHISFSSISYTTTFPTSHAYTGYGNGNGNSANTNWASAYTGLKLIHFPLNTLLSPGQYWVGLQYTSSTSSRDSGKIGMSFVMDRPINISYVTQLAPLGSFSSDGIAGSVSNQFYRFAPMVGWGSWSAAALTSCPATLAISAISTGNDSIPVMAIWRT